jgi:acetyl-CoA acetyltransferase
MAPRSAARRAKRSGRDREWGCVLSISPLSQSPIYIAGVAETPLGKVLDQSELSMVALAAKEALAEAGLGFKDVDGLFVNYMGEEGSVQVGEYLGIQPRYADSSDMGGGSFEAFVHHAMLAVAAGRCEVALITYASRQRSRRNRNRAVAAGPATLSGQFEAP